MMKDNKKKQIVQISGEDFVYYIRRSKRAKNLLLRVDISGQVEMVIPWRVSYREAERFIDTQTEWLIKMIKKNEERRRLIPCRDLVSGQRLPVFGDDYELDVECDVLRQRATCSEGTGRVKVMVGHEDDVRKVLTRWYKKKAHEYFAYVVGDYSNRLNVEVFNLAISGARSQWGSCMVNKKRVSLCWRLALASREVADYVVAHEVAHMKERGHNKKFWETVKSLDAEYSEHRTWLRKHGYTLVL
jgi:predicted metal-dependent hydrolase